MPPLRHVTTAAPNFMVLSTPGVLKNSLSIKAIAPSAGEEKYTGAPMTKASASASLGAISLTVSSNTHLPVSRHLRQAMQPRIPLVAGVNQLDLDPHGFQRAFLFRQSGAGAAMGAGFPLISSAFMGVPPYLHSSRIS